MCIVIDKFGPLFIEEYRHFTRLRDLDLPEKFRDKRLVEEEEDTGKKKKGKKRTKK